MDSFITLSCEGNSKTEVKQSVFIGKAISISSPEEANDFVKAQRSLYPDARHTVYAWKLSGELNMQKYSDDGEPSGTAGMPVLSILEHAGITNAAVAVTRYFGGILLGKGGLVRAYTDCAKQALINAVPVQMTEGVELSINVPYQLSDKVLFELSNLPCSVNNTAYLQDVCYKVSVETSNIEAVKTRLTDITSGVAVITKGDIILIKGREVLL